MLDVYFLQIDLPSDFCFSHLRIKIAFQCIFFSNMIIQIINLQRILKLCQVLSVKLDDWTDEQVDALMSIGGNTAVNKKYEVCIPDGNKKPKPDSSIEERFDFIR